MDKFEQKFKDTIEFVRNSGMESPNKPVIPHALRVGKFLFVHGMNDEVVIAGLLHDMLEWSGTSKQELEEKFGTKVMLLIEACSKDRSISDPYIRRIDQIKRSKKLGDDAFAIKIADAIDSFQYYSGVKNEKELERCSEWAKLLLENISQNLKEQFEKELVGMLKKSS